MSFENHVRYETDHVCCGCRQANDVTQAVESFRERAVRAIRAKAEQHDKQAYECHELGNKEHRPEFKALHYDNRNTEFAKRDALITAASLVEREAEHG